MLYTKWNIFWYWQIYFLWQWANLLFLQLFHQIEFQFNCEIYTGLVKSITTPCLILNVQR